MKEPKSRWIYLGTALLLIAATPSGAQAPRTQRAWEISSADRAASWKELASELPLRDSRGEKKEGHLIRLSGLEHPELMFNWMLFDYLIRNAFVAPAGHREEFRRAIEGRAAACGLGSDLWTRLEKVIGPFVENRRQQEMIARGRQGRSESREADTVFLADLADRDCGLRWQALSGARAEFGAEAVGRLLYEAVAPSYALVVDADDLDLGELQWVEEGCK